MTRTPSSNRVSAPDADPVEYSIDDLARVADTTVRNLRAYQDRGLIPPPERRGRIAVYGATHLSRLRAIAQLLERGYSLVSIGELIAAWESGTDLGSLLGLESPAESPWGEESPIWLTLPGLVQMFGGQFDPRWLSRAAESGLLELDGSRFRVAGPKLLQACADLVKLGIPFDEMLDVIVALRQGTQPAAARMARLVGKHLLERHGKGLPSAAVAADIGDAIWRLGPLVETAIKAEAARALASAADEQLGERLRFVLDRCRDSRRKAGG